MKRRCDEVNMQRTIARSSSIVACVAIVLATLTSCAQHERRAEKLWRQAQERVAQGKTEQAVELLQKLIDDYPDAEIAVKARDQIVLYRGLAHAVQSYPTRRARELMIQVSRAIETYRAANGRAPAALDELVPAQLAAIPDDPWGGRFVYEPAGRRYRLRCNGSDKAEGGTGDAADLIVADGEFSAAPP
jgi:hypothetical protein